MARSPEKADAFWLKSRFGNVRVYTRNHLDGCPFTSPNQQSCRCPKWIYAKPLQGEPRQYSVGTPSFTEAVEKAQEVLSGFNPMLAAAAALVSRPVVKGISVEKALTEFYAGKSRAIKSHSLNTIRCTFDRVEPHVRGRQTRLAISLLDFLDQNFPDLCLADIKGRHLDLWAMTWHLSDTTARSRRGIVNDFMNWAEQRELIVKRPRFSVKPKVRPGNRCGWFEKETYERLLNAIPFYKPGYCANHHVPLTNFVPRMRAFIELGRWSGMALADLVKFRPSHDLVGDVILYSRQKNGNVAGPIVIPAELADRLRRIPEEPGSFPGQPFRLHNDPIASGLQWRRRFTRLCKFAKISPIETQVGKIRQPHPHMLRDTFAIDAILRGVQLDNVSKMLGHSSIEMTQQNYLFWIKQREVMCEQQQRAALAGVMITPEFVSEPAVKSVQ